MKIIKTDNIMKKHVLLFSLLCLSLIVPSCSSDDNVSSTLALRIDKITFTELPVFVSAGPSPSLYDSFTFSVRLRNSEGESIEKINLKDLAIYDETTGLINPIDLTFSEVDRTVVATNIFSENYFGSTQNVNRFSDFQQLGDIGITDLDIESGSFEKSFEIAANSLFSNTSGFYKYTIYGTVVSE